MKNSSVPPALTERVIAARVLKRMRTTRDLTQEAAAELAGLTPGTWWRYENGERELPLDKLRPLAEALGFSLDDVIQLRTAFAGELTTGMAEDGPKVVPFRPPASARITAAELPIRDRVQAGAWLIADAHDQRAAITVPAPRDPRYLHAEQWLDTVVGDSVDLLRIFDGDLVQCVDAVAIGYYPRTGDIVEVERLRDGGRERQLTIKQVEIDGEGVVRLWPRSSNPQWREPIALVENGDTPESVEVRIRGLVLRAIRSF